MDFRSKFVLVLVISLLVINSFVLVFFIKKSITGESILGDDTELKNPISIDENKEIETQSIDEGSIGSSGSSSSGGSGSSGGSSSSGGGGFGGGSDNEQENGQENEQEQEEELKPVYFKLISPTSKWADFYGSLTIDNEPVQIGDEIAAFDPQGNLCGVFVVKNEGSYGFLHVYADDDTTLSIDEGAVSGDKITFKVFDSSKNENRTIDDEAIWQVGEITRINLSA